MRTALSPVAGLTRPIAAPRPKSSTRAITLSLPADVVRQVKDHAHHGRTTQAAVLMDALLATRDTLPRPLGSLDAALHSDGLFLRRARGNGEPGATLALRMLASNVEAIDALVAEHQAPSRSAYCLAALRAYLR